MAMSEERARALVESGRKKVQFGVDNKSFGEFILSDGVRDVTYEVTQDIMALAVTKTPVGEGRNGHMNEKYSADKQAGTLKVNKHFRVMCKIENDDPESALVEFGSKNNTRRRMLASAGAAFGDLKLKKGKEL